jgi:intracellular septation protein
MAQPAPAWIKPATEYGPLAVFFVVYFRFGLMPATAALIAATAFALGLALVAAGRVPWMPLITAAVVGVFGGLTLWLNDDTFIKMKPTIVQGLIAAVLVGGLAVRRPLLRPLMGAAWPMDDAGWRKLSLRFALFFAAMAAINEAVWRTQSTDVWVLFKVFGIIGLTFVFVLAQIPLMRRHHVDDGNGADAKERASE